MDDKELAKQVRDRMRNGDTDGAIALMGSDKSKFEMMTPFGTWLHVAASFGNLELVRRLVELGSDVNKRGGIAGGNALNVAASNGHLGIVAYLLDHGAEMDVSASERNPLFSAIYGGHADVVQTLIRSGIDPAVKYSGTSRKGMDALAFARERRQTAIEAILMQAIK